MKFWKKHWGNKMGWEWYLAIALGSLLVGLLSS